MEAKQDRAGVEEAEPGRVVATESDPGVTPQPMNPAAANEAVIGEVSCWDGVTVHEHQFGGVEFGVGRRELGHLHACFADMPFPRSVRDELVAAGRARPHHALPESGWVTVLMRTASEVTNVIELLRQNYDRATNTQRGAASSLQQKAYL